MIVDKIYTYLNEEGKTIDEAVLEQALVQFRRVLVRQLMKDREERPGRLYVTRFSHPCARKGAYQYHGFKGEDLQPRVKLNFLLGDMVELALMSVAKLAGCDIDLGNTWVSLKIDGQEIGGFIDGLYSDGEKLYVAEFKKVSPYSFQRIEKEGIDDTWGYISQVHAYMKALQIPRAVFVVSDGQTGALNERVVRFDEQIMEAMEERGRAILASTPDGLPPRAFLPIEETYYKKPTGKYKLDLQCSYCDMKGHCWPEAEFATKAGKPVWYLDKEASREFAEFEAIYEKGASDEK